MCIEGVCVPGDDTDPPDPGCGPDHPCAEGYVCVDGVCVDDGAPPPGCTSDHDCASGEKCIDAECVGGGPDPACASNADCPGDLLCVNGVCVQPPPSECVVSGCSGEICAPAALDSICLWEEWYVCLEFTKCGNYGPGGSCGWQDNDAYLECLKQFEGGGGGGEPCTSDMECGPGETCECLPDPDCPACAVCYFACVPEEPPSECVVSGCSGEICAAAPMGSFCVWEDWYVCLEYTGCGNFGPNGACGWELNEKYLACLEEFSGGGGGDECKSDADCAAGQVCVFEPCPACDCWPGDPNCYCPPCEGIGTCVDDPDEPMWCSTDSDCPAGYYCDCSMDPFAGGLVACFLVCVPEDEPELPCTSDADCPPDMVCTDWGCPDCACLDPSVPCECPPCFGTCAEKPPTIEACHSDSECPAGMVCDLENYCLPPPGCGPGQDCPAVCYGMCVPDQPPNDYDCTTDADCKPGLVCDFVVCSGCVCGPNEPCDCPPEPECWGHCAEPGPMPCWDDVDCPDGWYCDGAGAAAKVPCMEGDPDCGGVAPPPAGYCLPGPPPNTPCLGDAECPGGWLCNTADYCLSPPGCDDPTMPCPDVCYGLCEPPPDPGPVYCWGDFDCPAGQICLPMPSTEPTCDPADPDCPSGGGGAAPPAPPQGICVDDVPPPPDYECQVDADCLDGLVCQWELCAGCACADGGPCDCPPEPECWGWCVEPPPPYCWSDADCPAGQICELWGGGADPMIPCDPNDPDCGAPMPPAGMCVDLEPPPPTECKPSGCSGQVCSAEDVITTCEMQPWFTCLKYSECGSFAPDGGCGWAQTDAFLDCMTGFGMAP